MRKLLLTLIIFATAHSFGSNIDSISSVLNSDLSDSSKIVHSLRLIQQANILKKELADARYSKLEAFAKKSKRPLMLGCVYRDWANYYKTSQNDYGQALTYANKWIKWSEELQDSINLSAAYSFVGYRLYADLDLKKETLHALKKAVNYCRPNTKEHAWANYLLGWIEFNMRENDSSLVHLKLAYNEGVKARSGPPELIEYMGWVGNAYAGIKDYKNAILWRKKTLNYCEQRKYEFGVADCKKYLGQFYYALHQYDSAIYFSSYTFAFIKNDVNDNSKLRLIYTGQTLVGACIKANKITLAEKYVKDLTDTNLVRCEYGTPARVTLSDLLAKFYFAKGDETKTIYYLKDYIRAKDSADVSKQSAIVSETLLKNDFEKEQQQQFIQQKKKDLETEEQAKRQKLMIVSVSVVLLLVLLMLFLSYKSIKEKRASLLEIGKQKAEIEHQKEMVDEKNKEIIESITYAKRLQDAILPPLELISEKLPDSFIFYRPKDIVAGDFYWMEEADQKLFIAAADSTGHGVPGALVSIVCSNALNRSVKEFKLTDPGAILDKTRELVLETFSKSEDNVKDGMDISLLCIHAALPDNEEIQLTWSGANNPLWYIKQQSDNSHAVNNVLLEIKGDKQPIGLNDNPKPFTTHHVTLHKNDMVYLLTDGFADQFGGEKGKKFKYKQLHQALLSNKDKSCTEQKELLNSVFENWRGNLEQVDDVCVIGIKIL